MEWVLLVVPKDLEYNGLGFDVVHKRLCDLHRNVLYMVEAQGTSSSIVLEGFSGERFIMPMQKVELTEDVCILWKDPAGLEHSDSESEGTAQLQVVTNLFRKPFHHHLPIQQSA